MPSEYSSCNSKCDSFVARLANLVQIGMDLETMIATAAASAAFWLVLQDGENALKAVSSGLCTWSNLTRVSKKLHQASKQWEHARIVVDLRDAKNLLLLDEDKISNSTMTSFIRDIMKVCFGRLSAPAYALHMGDC